MHPRLARELETIEKMVGIHCRGVHGTKGALCEPCRELMEYAARRLERCKFQADKPNCAGCPIHCYKPDMRQRVKDVMRYSGPRMVYHHPWLALMHFIDGYRKRPELPGKKF